MKQKVEEPEKEQGRRAISTHYFKKKLLQTGEGVSPSPISPAERAICEKRRAATYNRKLRPHKHVEH